MVYRYLVNLSFKGSNYCGWQRQPNSLTVQEVLENAMTLILRNKIFLVGCGRTDTGVHAISFYAHFDYNRDIEAIELERFTLKLNGFLPQDIVVNSIVKVNNGLHARFSALQRTYNYHISIAKDPFKTDFSWQLTRYLNIEKMCKAANSLLKYNNFESFCKSNSHNYTSICTIYESYFCIEGDKLKYVITANRFLRNMVRALVGTFVNIGIEKISSDDLINIIEAKNRALAGESAPAKGLFLTNVVYPENLMIFNKVT